MSTVVNEPGAAVARQRTYDADALAAQFVAARTANGVASATAATTNVLICPSGRRNSPATMRKIEPSTAPSIVRRPPSTAAMMICTPMPISTTVLTDAVP